MATWTFGTNSVATGALSKPFTASEVNFVTWLNSLRSSYGQPNATDVQVQQMWAQENINREIARVQSYQQQQAAAAVTPIPVT